MHAHAHTHTHIRTHAHTHTCAVSDIEFVFIRFPFLFPSCSALYVDQLTKVVRRGRGGPGVGVAVPEMNDWNCAFTFDTVMEASLGVDLGNLEEISEGRPLDTFLQNFKIVLPQVLQFSTGWQVSHARSERERECL